MLKLGINLEGKNGRVVLCCQMCSLSTQKWGEQGKVISAQFTGLGCYYDGGGEVDYCCR